VPKLRPAQFCIFLAALVGTEQMERTMLQAIDVAKQTQTRGRCLVAASVIEVL
jgi:hypothetical protein